MKYTKKRAISDPVIASVIGGVLGTLGDEIVHWSAVLLKITQSTTGHYISQLIFPFQKVTLPRLLMGEFTHILAGGTLGIAIIIILKISGFEFAVIKGAGFGAVMWIVHVIVIPNLVAPRPYLFRTYNESIIDLVSHIVWGAITAWFILIDQKIITQNSEKCEGGN
ncbi:MAG: hypothetical protein RO469_08945 [Thermincola sp.]|jgi:uncharacterized membrane protein YagU involved in acid resistance|nr:hypothetical protein [Thermincola sp.]MDT3704668.1 hypothetical protein [Thermincola sp.]